MSETFDRVWTVRFSDTDPFGIAHYPRIVDALHETADIFMQEIGFPFWEITEQSGYGLPIVEMNCEFKNPVEAGDEVDISCVVDLGSRSIRFSYVGRLDGTVVFSGYEQRVCAEKGGGSIEIPSDLRAALAPFAEE